MRGNLLLALLALLPVAGRLSGQLPAQRIPDTVFLQDLTWDEVRDLVASGRTSILIAAAGTEEQAPHLALGSQSALLQYTVEKIARRLGNALVAPVIPYAPRAGGTAGVAGAAALSLPQESYVALLENAARSLIRSGFRDILFLGDSGGSQSGLREATERLNRDWSSQNNPARAHFIGDYYAKSLADMRGYLGRQGVSAEAIAEPGGVVATSQLLYIDARHVRLVGAGAGSAPSTGRSGASVSAATADLGSELLDIKIENALAQIRTSLRARGGE
jgi:creatinine amidohydrolase/Fe(II)-dependent formamide hydrolase-like protein